MAEGQHGEIGFYAFEPRGVLPLDDRFIIRKSLRQILHRGEFEVRIDTAFSQVIRHCARYGKLPNQEIWLSEEMIGYYEELHAMGYAHSVEIWMRPRAANGELLNDQPRELVGGLYGLTLGSAFFGESMFSLQPNASQIALVYLVQHLIERGFTLLDTQMSSNHLKQFGLIEYTHEEYLHLLEAALSIERSF